MGRSASICDIRPVSDYSNVYYATVRQTGQVPEARLREKSDKKYYTDNRVSAHFSSSGHPVRPPRRNKKPNTDLHRSYEVHQNNYLVSGRPNIMPTRGQYHHGDQYTLSRRHSLAQIPRQNSEGNYHRVSKGRTKNMDEDKTS